MMLTQWLAGPQLIGLVILGAGLIQQKWPPTDVDGLYGYRTEISRTSQQIFDEGNMYSARLMVKMGLIALIAGLLIAPFIDRKHLFITPILTLVTVIGITILLRLKTEQHLKNMIDDNKA